MTTTEYRIGDLCSFAKGASVPRDRMKKQGLRYLHYGDLYAGHSLYIDVENPERPLPFIDPTEKLRADQFVNNGDIIYILTSETVEDLGKSLCLSNPKHRTVVAGTETTVMQVARQDKSDQTTLSKLPLTDAILSAQTKTIHHGHESISRSPARYRQNRNLRAIPHRSEKDHRSARFNPFQNTFESADK